jgi:DUF438 domain-containing protein
MNMQKRSEERSKTLHKEIAKRLRDNPKLWTIPKRNIDRWKKEKTTAALAYAEWECLLDTLTREEILAILENDSETSIRLRSSSPFTGILSIEERNAIFESYRR